MCSHCFARSPTHETPSPSGPSCGGPWSGLTDEELLDIAEQVRIAGDGERPATFNVRTPLGTDFSSSRKSSTGSTAGSSATCCTNHAARAAFRGD